MSNRSSSVLCRDTWQYGHECSQRSDTTKMCSEVKFGSRRVARPSLRRHGSRRPRSGTRPGRGRTSRSSPRGTAATAAADAVPPPRPRPRLRAPRRPPRPTRRRARDGGARARTARTPAPRAPAGGRSSPTRRREPEVVDLLAALALDEKRRLEAERPEHRRVERERPLQVAADEVDVAEADEHGRTIRCRSGVRHQHTAHAFRAVGYVRATSGSTIIALSGIPVVVFAASSAPGSSSSSASTAGSSGSPGSAPTAGGSWSRFAVCAFSAVVYVARYGSNRFGEQRRHVRDPHLRPHLAHAVVEHHRAERARDRERLRARLRRFASRARR